MNEFDPIAYKNMVKTYQANDDPLGWFDSIYKDAQGDYKSVFWADLEPSPYLVAWLKKHTKPLHDNAFILVSCRSRNEGEQLDDIPLPLDKNEIDGFIECGLQERSFLAYDDENSVPHFFATYQK